MYGWILARGAFLSAVVFLLGVLAVPSSAIGAQGDCSQPLSSGANPTASDCLFILNVAVGAQTCSPQACVCDPSGGGGTTASDALLCLKKAVAEPVTLLCPCSDCINDGNCTNDDCVCPDCDDDLFCGDPANCFDNGTCNEFTEGCVCVDCMTHPECVDN